LYEVIKYPAGEIQTRLTAAGLEAAKKADSFEIIANPIPDIIELGQLNDALQGVKPFFESSLYLPYLPYGRADRRFQEGDCLGLKVFGDFISTMGFTAIWSYDIHNPDAADEFISDGVANLTPDSNDEDDQIMPCLRKMAKETRIHLRKMAKETRIHLRKSACLLAPDKGAAARYDLEQYGLPVLQGEKVRDPKTGKLSGFHIDPAIKNYRLALIVDDICDGGGTFIGLAQEIRKVKPNIILGLFVSHGIFSKGKNILFREFDYLFASDETFNGTGSANGLYFKTGRE